MSDWRMCDPATMFADKWGDFDDCAIDRALLLAGNTFALGEPGEIQFQVYGFSRRNWATVSLFANDVIGLMRRMA